MFLWIEACRFDVDDDRQVAAEAGCQWGVCLSHVSMQMLGKRNQYSLNSKTKLEYAMFLAFGMTQIGGERMYNNPYKSMTLWRLAIVFLAAAMMNGCATQGDSRDPWEPFNRGVFQFNDTLDKYMMQPIAKGYQWVTPEFVDQGVTNFFDNLNDIAVTANDLFQFKFKQSGQDVARLLINSTLGIGGFVDVATEIGLVKHNEDFGQTLAIWGVPYGPYLVLPFLGPSSPRDAIGTAADGFMNPLSYTPLFPVRIGFFSLKTIDFRADNLSATEILDEAALDRYAFMRNAYFQRREYLIYDGEPPLDDEFEDFEKELEEEM